MPEATSPPCPCRVVTPGEPHWLWRRGWGLSSKPPPAGIHFPPVLVSSSLEREQSPCAGH